MCLLRVYLCLSCQKAPTKSIMLKVAACEAFCLDVPAGHRFPMQKYRLLPEYLISQGIITADNLFRPRPISDHEILTTHSQAYLSQLTTGTLDAKACRKIGLPMSQALIERERLVVGATYECARHAQRFGISLSVSGGTHHAFFEHGEGFCILNDICIASHLLLAQGLVKRILIVDLDVHQGNGNAAIMTDNPSVFVFSMHGEKNYPFIKPASDLDIGLPDGTDDTSYLQLLNTHLPQIIKDFAPDFIFYQAGVDVLASDSLGKLSLTPQGCRTRDAMVLKAAKAQRIPITVVMGGGYSPDINVIVQAHAQVFELAVALFGR